MSYSKFSFTLGQQLTLDGKDILITGLLKTKIEYRNIITNLNGHGLQGPRREIDPNELEKLYDAHVAGLGTGVLSVKMPEKYSDDWNPFDVDSREFKNWNFGFEAGKQHELSKQAKS